MQHQLEAGAGAPARALSRSGSPDAGSSSPAIQTSSRASCPVLTRKRSAQPGVERLLVLLQRSSAPSCRARSRRPAGADRFASRSRAGASCALVDGVAGDDDQVGRLLPDQEHQRLLARAEALGVQIGDVGDPQRLAHRAGHAVAGDLQPVGLDQVGVGRRRRQDQQRDQHRPGHPPAARRCGQIFRGKHGLPSAVRGALPAKLYVTRVAP